MDSVFVEGLTLRGKHGVEQHERENEQDFLIDISVEMDTRAAAHSDVLSDTADYTKFVSIARECVEEHSFYLIEKLGESIAKGILGDNRVVKVAVTIRKPAVLPNGVPGVKIIRVRN